MIFQPIPEKRCTKCRQWFPYAYLFFKRDSRVNHPVQPCKECAKKDSSKWAKDHPEKANQRTKQWNEQHPEKRKQSADQCAKRAYKKNPEKYRQQTRQRWINSPESVKASRQRSYAKNRDYYHRKNKIWRAQHPEQMKELNNRWRQNNPLKVKEIRARATRIRRARKADAPGEFTKQDLQQIYQEQDGYCFWCSCELGDDFQPDHLIPLSRNGTNWPDNIVASCPRCNQSKKDRLPFIEWQPKYPLKTMEELMLMLPILSAVLQSDSKHK